MHFYLCSLPKSIRYIKLYKTVVQIIAFIMYFIFDFAIVISLSFDSHLLWRNASWRFLIKEKIFISVFKLERRETKIILPKLLRNQNYSYPSNPYLNIPKFESKI